MQDGCKVVMGALQAIQQLSIEEVEEVLVWLDEATSAYRAVLAVKRILDKRPVQIPASAVDVFNKQPEPTNDNAALTVADIPKTPSGRLKRGYLVKVVEEYMTKQTTAIKTSAVASGVGASHESVLNTLINNPHLFTRIGNKWLWNGHGNPDQVMHYTQDEPTSTTSEPT